MKPNAAHSPKVDVYIPPEFVEHQAALKALTIGDTLRVCHKYKEDGSPCSVGKDKAMMISKYSYFYYYYCHRCGAQGKVKDLKSPQQLASELRKDAEREERKSPAVTHRPKLPTDCISMTNANVPPRARAFLTQYGITNDLIKKYEIKYSRMYDRIIFPIKEFYVMTRRTGTIDIGWVGRCYHPLEKQTRIERNRPKYLIRKFEKDTERMFWTQLNKDVDYTAIVEDIISAIRIHESCQINVIALLTTSLPDWMFPCFKDQAIVLWLDHDMMFKSLQYVNRMTTCGIKAGHISTPHDPKTYDESDLRNIIGRKIVDVAK